LIKQALRIKTIGSIKTFSRVYPKKASTRRVNRKIAESTRNQRVFFSRYLAAKYSMPSAGGDDRAIDVDRGFSAAFSLSQLLFYYPHNLD